MSGALATEEAPHALGLVSAALDAGIPVRAVAGPSALAAALSVSGFPANRVVFDGFLPIKSGKRRRAIEALASQDRTIVLRLRNGDAISRV